VPIHCLPLGFCAVASNVHSPMKAHVSEFANSLFMAILQKNVLLT